MYRHGDVLVLQPVPLPADAAKQKTNVVAEGEVTGHAHLLRGGDIYSRGGSLFLTTGERAALTHEEHKRLELPATDRGMAFPVIIQREYDDQEEWRKVAD